eukprot:1162130-Pelagomonas_calceolata.AAC.6
MADNLPDPHQFVCSKEAPSLIHLWDSLLVLVLNVGSFIRRDYTVKSHNGVLGNEGTDALALEAAEAPQTAASDTSLNQAEIPSSIFTG